MHLVQAMGATSRPPSDAVRRRDGAEEHAPGRKSWRDRESAAREHVTPVWWVSVCYSPRV